MSQHVQHDISPHVEHVIPWVLTCPMGFTWEFTCDSHKNVQKTHISCVITCAFFTWEFHVNFERDRF